MGGMDLLHFQLYYWASNLRALVYWLQTHTNNETPPGSKWRQMQASHYPFQPCCIQQCLSHHAVHLLPPSLSISAYMGSGAKTLRLADFVPQ